MTEKLKFNRIISIITVFVLLLSVMSVMQYDIRVYAATDYNFCFPVNNGVKIAYYQGYTAAYGADHDGIDIHSNGDDTIYAAYDGVVEDTANSCPHINYGGKCAHWTTYGNYIRIKGDNGIYFYYGHLKQNGLKVKKGDKVKKGQPIAVMGSSGYSTGKHLHFEIRKTTSSSTRLNANPKGTLNGLVTYKNGSYGSDDPYEPYDNVATGIFFFKNIATGKYLSVDGGKAANGQNLSVASEKNTNTFKFNISKSGSDYCIATMLDNNYLVNPYSDTPADKTNMTLYKKSGDGTQNFRFKKVADNT